MYSLNNKIKPATANVGVFDDSIGHIFESHVSLRAVYGIESSNTVSLITTGGGVTAVGGEYKMSMGISGGSAYLRSKKPLIYIPGIGMETRHTTRFASPIADTKQISGCFTSSDGLCFGYNGISFGVLHRYDGEYEIQNLTTTVAASGSETATVTLNGTGYDIPLTAGDITHNAHEIEEYFDNNVTAWNLDHIKANLYFVAENAEARASSYGVSSTGTYTGTISRSITGTAPTEDWIYQPDWNKSTSSWLVPTKGNVYRIEHAYLGYGPTKYYIMNPTSLRWEKVHEISWGNANTSPNLLNPSLHIGWNVEALNSNANETDLVMYGASGMGGTHGKGRFNTIFGYDAQNSSVNAETSILGITCRHVFKDRRNRGFILFKLMTLGTDSTKGAIFNIYRNTAVAVDETNHDFVDEQNSIAIADTFGSVVTGGTKIGSFIVGATNSIIIDSSTFESILYPGDKLTITAQAISGSASIMNVALIWKEIF